MWIDDELRVSYYGDMIAGADRIRFKFGPYRHHMTQATDAGLNIEDIKIYYSNVGKSDKSEIIIDEVLGQLLVLMFIELEFLQLFCAFILFRFFDILKIFPANIIDKKYSNHYGVICDDIIAAMQALIVIFVFKFSYGKFF